MSSLKFNTYISLTFLFMYIIYIMHTHLACPLLCKLTIIFRPDPFPLLLDDPKFFSGKLLFLLNEMYFNVLLTLSCCCCFIPLRTIILVSSDPIFYFIRTCLRFGSYILALLVLVCILTLSQVIVWNWILVVYINYHRT